MLGSFITIFKNAKTLHYVKSNVQSLKNWPSCPINLVLADNSGNIAYAMLSSAPVRKNDYPYLGTKILDGQTTEHDWEGLIDIKLLPFHMNPKKGYFMTANQKIVPDNSRFDVGAAMTSTSRALRLEELIEAKIKSGKKFDV